MTELAKDQIQSNLRAVKETIHETALSCDRDPDAIQLVVVTKGHTAGTVKALVDAGHTDVGESYVQEAAFKLELFGDYDINWHMIGHIQSGKEREVAARYDMVHSVDRMSLAQGLNKAAGEAERVLPVLLECNVSGEETKHGWAAHNEEIWPALAEEIGPVFDLPHLQVRGLMMMAPYHQDPEHSRPYFQRLRALQAYLQEQFPVQALEALSMGMSADYQVAIEEGASILRVGTAIVGPRN
jgi:hypothetical protein